MVSYGVSRRYGSRTVCTGYGRYGTVYGVRVTSWLQGQSWLLRQYWLVWGLGYGLVRLRQATSQSFWLQAYSKGKEGRVQTTGTGQSGRRRPGDKSGSDVLTWVRPGYDWSGLVWDKLWFKGLLVTVRQDKLQGSR